ncbi:MAG: RES family NAD+ phosphorylase [Comamonadaceae bacterium]|uniref:RES family NAD+ phosphorylase n=1 Tax=Candidatus Skiveiella danica TaxID=3386177 RepID=UPI001B457A5F|nr:RES family NAD+ phosphorylase [Comamonadaceae bacterium]MBK9200236.1 RES family NAD+ phosphorylase [Betaproteobacteria bacterium]MBP6502466.1 RES family NAD+ phosphorylase [Rhodoferax sp.]MBK6556977.1 RES family NAD+ phosphorylase [Comamonadaceae bacterium]MBK7118339.1 RES family NAD+ phosphorylase [Comamonadaceae bacterium]
MPKPRKLVIPAARTAPQEPIGIRELDRFSSESIDRWTALSNDLDELEANLYFALEPERRRLRPELIAALQQHQTNPLVIQGWVRIVDYQFTNMPLSSAGSLTGYGARFNAGMDLDPGTLNPWPALYIAEDYETAYREKFQLKSSQAIDGLKPEELALEHGRSHTTVLLQGRIERVFDMTLPRHLEAVAKVLKKIKLPERAKTLKKKLRMKPGDLSMIQSGRGLYDAVLKHNWRVLPVQFGLPARSHILAELIRVAGFEAILYKSTMGPGKCLAVFPDQLSGQAYVELVDKAPPEVRHTRLDDNSAGDLAGWHILPPSFRR